MSSTRDDLSVCVCGCTFQLKKVHTTKKIDELGAPGEVACELAANYVGLPVFMINELDFTKQNNDESTFDRQSSVRERETAKETDLIKKSRSIVR